MRTCLTMLWVCLAVLTGSAGRSGAATVGSLNHREVLVCGPNALFVFLILSGRSDISLEQLREIPISMDGASLLALRDAARQLRVDAEIRRFANEDLDLMPLPAIGQFCRSGSVLTAYHFDVIYKVDSDYVYVIDGTTGMPLSFRRSRLPDYWNNFAMIEAGAISARIRYLWLGSGLACLLAIELAVIAACFRRFGGQASRRSVGRTIGSKASAAIIALTLWGAPGIATGTEPFPTHAWRCSTNGGINVLFCYLGANGAHLDYADLLRVREKENGQEQDTALTLSRLAAKYGFPLQPMSLTVDDLSRCALPLIVHVDGATPEEGAFLLILSMTDKELTCLNGPSASVHSLSREEFRRIWSGIALMPAKQSLKSLLFCGAGIAVGIALALGFQAGRFKLFNNKG